MLISLSPFTLKNSQKYVDLNFYDDVFQTVKILGVQSRVGSASWWIISSSALHGSGAACSVNTTGIFLGTVICRYYLPAY